MGKKENPSGIYLLPNLLTTANLFAAFYSIVASVKEQYETAAVAIFIGLITDSLDGRIARLTNSQTAFGAEYDSLSDMVTFGVAPALLSYCWGLQRLGKVGWLIAFIYAAAVALRLARFNTRIENTDKRYFQGLACPAGAALISSFIWLCDQNAWTQQSIVRLMAGLSIIIAVLMVSNVRYYSFKELDFKGKVPFLYILVIVFLFAAIAAYPPVVLFGGFTIYALSGLLQTVLTLKKIRNFRRKSFKAKKTIR